ncbi:MAG: ABC transporter substrate-binding protein [Nitrospinota bacterium]|nr:ABC transporter substrate-binding protein [Nitrospinota bacterium]
MGDGRWMRFGWSAMAAALLFLAGSAAAEKVKVRLDWVLRGNHAMFHVAKDKGYFKQNGIDVTKIDPGNGSVRTMKFVGGGQYPFGYGDLPTLATAKSKGVPVTSLVVVNQLSPMSFVTLADSGIKKPKDIEGRKMGVFPGGSTRIFYLAFTKMLGIDRKKVKEVAVSFPYESYLLTRKVDAITGYLDAEIPILKAKAKIHVMQGAKYGYKGYGSGVLAADNIIQKNPDLVRRFTKAYIQGFVSVIKNPDEAVEILARYQKKAPKKVWRAQLQADIDSSFMDERTRARGLGWQTGERWKVTQQILVDQGIIKNPVAVGTLFTNDFLKGSPKM